MPGTLRTLFTRRFRRDARSWSTTCCATIRHSRASRSFDASERAGIPADVRPEDFPLRSFSVCIIN